MSEAPSAWKIEQAISAWMSIRSRLLAEDESLAYDEAALAELLGPEEGDIETILARLLRATVHAEAMAAGAAERAKMMATRKARYEGRADAMRGTIFAIMETLGRKKVELPDLTASLGTGRQSVRVTDLAAVPDIYVEIVTERKPDKATILADLKSGREVAGCELGNGMPTLTIRKG